MEELGMILEDDFLNFRPLLLHDCKLVVHGLDFVRHVCKDIPSAYGSENLYYHLKIKDILSAFKTCGIHPYFVFDSGIIKYQGNDLDNKLRKLSDELRSYLEKAQNNETKFDFLPIGAQLTCIGTLRQDRIDFVNVSSRPLNSVVTLASCLGCPFLAATADFYVQQPLRQHHSAADTSLPPFIPLRHFDMRPISTPMIDDKLCWMLTAHEFLRSCPCLKSVPPDMRPILALLMANDSISRLVNSKIDKRTNEDPRKQLFKFLCDYLSRFVSNSDNLLRSLADYCPTENRETFMHNLVSSLPTYFVDLNDIDRRMIERFRLNKFVTDRQVASDADCSDRMNVFLTSVLKQAGNTTSCMENVADVTTRWPKQLTSVFENGRMHSNYLSALYTPCIFFSVDREDPSFEFSINHPCLPLRWMHYCVFAGLEESLGTNSKLIGLCPHATEYVRRGSRLVACAVHVQPTPIDPQYDRTDQLIRAFLHSSLSHKPCEDGMIFTLAVILKFWYVHSTEPHWNSSSGFHESSFVLAFAVCAVVCFFERDQLDWPLWEHYKQLSESMETGQTHSPTVHQFAELQLVYTSFQSLINVIDSLVELDNQSELFHFPVLFSIFPSARLVHNLTITLDTQPPPVRRQIVSRYWLPRLCRPKLDTSVCSSELNWHLNQLLDVAMSLDIPLIQITSDVYEVDCFTPLSLELDSPNPSSLACPSNKTTVTTSATTVTNPTVLLQQKNFYTPPASRSFYKPQRKSKSAYAKRLESRLSENPPH